MTNSLDELLQRGRNFYHIRDTGNALLIFYAIRDKKDFADVFLDLVAGAHLQVKTDKGNVDLVMVNLLAHYDERSERYVLRSLIGTILHEYCHWAGVSDNYNIDWAVKQALRGYKFSRIKV